MSIEFAYFPGDLRGVVSLEIDFDMRLAGVSGE